MGRNNISIKTYKRKPQIWFGTEADSFSYDFVWHLPMQMCLDGDILRFKREGNILIFLNHKIVNEEKISIKNGDQIQIEEFTITFFKEKLEVQADAECFETTLQNVRKKNTLKDFLFINVLQELYIREKKKRWKLRLRPGKKKCPEVVWHS